LNEIMFMSLAISNLPPLAGRFGIILRVPRVETRLKPWAELCCPFGTKTLETRTCMRGIGAK
jgi:hypothetical protein